MFRWKGAREDGWAPAPLVVPLVELVSVGPAVPWGVPSTTVLWGVHVPMGSVVLWDMHGSVKITLWDVEGSMHATKL